ncbi:hypothetical protein CDAR_466691, partial [Caerostris darwini]
FTGIESFSTSAVDFLDSFTKCAFVHFVSFGACLPTLELLCQIEDEWLNSQLTALAFLVF